MTVKEYNELRELFDSFSNRWNIESVKKMTLKDYVGVNNKDTFCQWVETKTRMLGSIKGMTSIKFGIYERKKPNDKPKKYINGIKYSWMRTFGNNEKEVFENIKKEILKIIEYSEKGLFNEIDKLSLPNLFKWKVAFLYSNERLIPIYKKTILFKIANHLGLEKPKKERISEIQELMIQSKPIDQNSFEYMWYLYKRFSRRKDVVADQVKRKKRKGTLTRNISSHKRTITRSFIVEQRHNKIQKALQIKLENEFGKENVILEENYVDIKLFQPKFINFYEVKSAPFAVQCIKEALGQVLFYIFNDEDKRNKNIIVVGQYPASKTENKYINYIKEKLKIDFQYINVNI